VPHNVEGYVACLNTTSHLRVLPTAVRLAPGKEITEALTGKNPGCETTYRSVRGSSPAELQPCERR